MYFVFSDETREVDGRARSESGDADSVYHVRGALHDQRWRDNQVRSLRSSYLCVVSCIVLELF